MLAFIHGLTASRVLPADVVQLDGSDARKSFNGQQRIRSLDRSVLTRVTRQDQPRISFAHQPDQIQHLPSTNLSGLVHNDSSTFGQFTFYQKIGDGCR